MDRNRLDKIIEFNRGHDLETRTRVSLFLEDYNVPIITDIGLLVTEILEIPGVKFIHIPLEMDAGACFLALSENKCFVIINTNKSRAENNFAIAHELYHVEFGKKISFTDYAEESDEEMLANAFAGNLLMPKEHFKNTYLLLQKMVKRNFKDRSEQYLKLVLFLMEAYKTTYMSVVIRCIELFPENYTDEVIKHLLDCDHKEAVEKAVRLSGIYGDMLQPSLRNDIIKLVNEVKKAFEDDPRKKENYDYLVNEFLDAVFECTGMNIEDLNTPFSEMEV